MYLCPIPRYIHTAEDIESVPDYKQMSDPGFQGMNETMI